MPTAPAPSPRIIRSKQRLPCVKGAGSRVSRKRETDEGLASPYGRGAPGRGGEGVFYPLSHFVTAPPEWEPRGDCDRWESLKGHTSDIGCLLPMTRISCRFSCRGGQWPPAFYADFQRKWAANGRPSCVSGFSVYPTVLIFPAVIVCQGMSMGVRPPNCSFSQAS